MDEMLESLFMDFLETAPTNAHAAAMHRLSSIIDRQIDAGAVDADTIADYECAAMKFGFAAGFAAATKSVNTSQVA